MLHDTDFFDKLPEWTTLGGDVAVTVEWEEAAGPDERYDIALTWHYKRQRLGDARFSIEQRFDPDTQQPFYRVFWQHLEFADNFQDKGFYATLMAGVRANLPRYGISEVQAAPLSKEAERRLITQGFEWRGHEFVVDLTRPV
jgi:hypothetical protein